jgi:hypothetical protein
VARLSDIVSSLGRPVCTGLKKMKGLAPHPWAITQPTVKSHNQVDACVFEGERHPSDDDDPFIVLTETKFSI